jgi:hypothetical protein
MPSAHHLQLTTMRDGAAKVLSGPAYARARQLFVRTPHPTTCKQRDWWSIPRIFFN